MPYAHILLLVPRMITHSKQELLTRIEYLIQERETVTAQRQRDAQLALSWETERAQYMNWYKGVIRVMTENSFVMVLIDGDGMIVSLRVRPAQISSTDQSPVQRRFHPAGRDGRPPCSVPPLHSCARVG